MMEKKMRAILVALLTLPLVTAVSGRAAAQATTTICPSAGASGCSVTATGGATQTLGNWFQGITNSAGSLALTSLNSTPIGATTPSTGAFTTLSASGATALTNQGSATTLTLSGNASTLSNTNTVAFLNMSGFVAGSPTVTTQIANLLWQDKMTPSGSGLPGLGFQILHNVAPNSNTASGNRITFSVNQTDNPGGTGTYTNPGINQASQFTLWAQGNEGGSSSVYQGAHTTMGITCTLYGTATFSLGCAGGETDVSAKTSASFDRNTQWLYVHTPDNAVVGRLGPDLGIVITDAASVGGYKHIFQLGSQSNWFPGGTNSALVYAVAGGQATNTLATAIDTSSVTYSSCLTREPYAAVCRLIASGITGATRLTTDGSGSATSFTYEAVRDVAGTGYTSNPTISITGCTGGDIEARLGLGGALQEYGIHTPATACAAEATIAVSGGGGSSATGHLIIAGNTLNLPIHSATRAACTATATTFAHSGTDAVTWSTTFLVTVGATASTTTIVGSPTWTTDFQTTGAAAKFSGSAPATPAADTTLGAVNLSITPTTGTWDVTADCKMVAAAAQIL